MMDGYGRLGAPSGRMIGLVLKSAPCSMTVLTILAVLLTSRKTARADPTVVLFVRRPSASGAAVKITTALLPRARLLRLQNKTPLVRIQPPRDVLMARSCMF